MARLPCKHHAAISGALLPDDFTGLTLAGWPRPRFRTAEGRIFPVPWITPVPHFASTDPRRRNETRITKACQVCGLQHEDGAEIVIFLDGPIRNRAQEPLGKVFKAVLADTMLKAIDDAIMHERCARLAAGACPRMQQKRKSGQFFPFAGPIEAVEAVENRKRPIHYSSKALEMFAGDVEQLPKYEMALMLDGFYARPFEL